MAEKACSRCGLTLSVEMFWRRTSSVTGLQSACKTCMTNEDRARIYGLDRTAFDLLFDAQAGRCAICQRPDRTLVIDHNHETGAVRGLLCGRCNSAIGMLGDDADTVLAAHGYLQAN